MEAELFGILKLTPGHYSPSEIIDRHRQVRGRILNESGPDRQRRLDDALIACILLQDPKRQAELLNRVNRDAQLNAKLTRRRQRQAQAARKPMAVPHRRNISRPSTSPKTIEVPGKQSTAKQPDTGTDSSLSENSRRFADMVAASVQNGILRMTARRQLLVKAQALGIGEFKANLVIAEVLHDLSLGWRPDTPASPTTPASPATPASSQGQYIPVTRPRYGLRIALAAILATIIDLFIIVWLHR